MLEHFILLTNCFFFQFRHWQRRLAYKSHHHLGAWNESIGQGNGKPDLSKTLERINNVVEGNSVQTVEVSAMAVSAAAAFDIHTLSNIFWIADGLSVTLDVLSLTPVMCALPLSIFSPFVSAGLPRWSESEHLFRVLYYCLLSVFLLFVCHGIGVHTHWPFIVYLRSLRV